MKRHWTKTGLVCLRSQLAYIMVVLVIMGGVWSGGWPLGVAMLKYSVRDSTGGGGYCGVAVHVAVAGSWVGLVCCHLAATGPMGRSGWNFRE